MAVGEITETRTYLTFTLDQEDFAVDVAGVREVLDYTTVTRVPRTPVFMKGVINLRGSVVPVVDMRLKFGLLEAEKTVDTCVIVLEVELDGEVTVIGAIADSVKAVFELASKDIEPPPRLGTRFKNEFISGMGKSNDVFIIILDVNKVFSVEEMELFRQAEEGMSQSQTLPDPARFVEDPPKNADDSAEEVVTQEDDIPKDTNGEPEKPDEETTAKKTARTEKTPPKATSMKAGKSTRKAEKLSAKKS